MYVVTSTYIFFANKLTKKIGTYTQSISDKNIQLQVFSDVIDLHITYSV